MIFIINPEKDPGSNFIGYFRNEEASEKKVLRDAFIEGDRWFRTGDLIYTDDNYMTYFDDRIGDTYRWKGENVSTMEVAAIMGEVPGIAEANVYGIRLPNHDGRAGVRDRHCY